MGRDEQYLSRYIDIAKYRYRQISPFSVIILCTCWVWVKISPAHIVVVAYRQVIWPRWKLWCFCCVLLCYAAYRHIWVLYSKRGSSTQNLSLVVHQFIFSECAMKSSACVSLNLYDLPNFNFRVRSVSSYMAENAIQ